jgi:hypothetical protein
MTSNGSQSETWITHEGTISFPKEKQAFFDKIFK